MAHVLIGSARSSYGNTSPGDQNNGKEVSTENWYAHSKGWVLLRAKDPTVREKIAVAMERACANNDIGYDQSTRNTLYNNVKPYGFDPSRTTKKVNTDCSALSRVCVNFAGIAVGDYITSSEAATLMATGAFDKYTDDAHCKSSDYLLRGDILVTRTKGHTVVVLSNGEKAAEEVSVTPEPVPTGGLHVKSGSWNVRSGPGTSYPVVQTVHGGDVLAGIETDWKPVRIDGKIAWISPKAVTLLRDAQARPAAVNPADSCGVLPETPLRGASGASKALA